MTVTFLICLSLFFFAFTSSPSVLALRHRGSSPTVREGEEPIGQRGSSPTVIEGEQKQNTQTIEANEHNYVPLREVEIEIKDFTFPTPSGKTIKLSEAAKGKKLILVHYFAAWCHNSNFDVKTMTDIYSRYFDQGLLVIGVCEYSKNDELRQFIEKHKPTYPICIEGEGKKKDRTGTTHYAYRKKVDDQRVWGTPLNILISAEDLLAEGEIVARRVRVAPGEVIKSELEELIREKLSKK